MLPQQLAACDACSLFMGVTPMDLSSEARLSFRHRSFRYWRDLPDYLQGSNKVSHSGHGPGIGIPSFDDYEREQYQTISASFRWTFHPRWNVFVRVPFMVQSFRTVDTTSRVRNIGDITTQLNYLILDGVKGQHQYRLFGGIGVKAPTGFIYKTKEESRQYLDLQTGTGSWDAMGSLQFSYRYKNGGVFGSALARLNTNNQYDIRYGNFYNFSANGFYILNLYAKTMRIMPYLGTYYEQWAGVFEEGELLYDSGGRVLYGNIGLNTWYKRLGLLAQFQVPLAQQANGWQLSQRPAFTLELSYSFNACKLGRE